MKTITHYPALWTHVSHYKGERVTLTGNTKFHGNRFMVEIDFGYGKKSYVSLQSLLK